MKQQTLTPTSNHESGIRPDVTETPSTPALEQFLAIPKCLDQLNARMITLESALGVQSQEISQIGSSVEHQKDGLRALHEMYSCLEAATERHTAAIREHCFDHVARGVAQRLFSLVDLADELGASTSGSNEARRLARGLGVQLAECLEFLGVESVRVREGTRFDPKLMRPCKQQGTSDPRRDRTVQRTVRRGFRRDGVMIRPIAVSVYTFIESKDIQEVRAQGEQS